VGSVSKCWWGDSAEFFCCLFFFSLMGLLIGTGVWRGKNAYDRSPAQGSEAALRPDFGIKNKEFNTVWADERSRNKIIDTHMEAFGTRTQQR
jgi:hypothetical protein